MWREREREGERERERERETSKENATPKLANATKLIVSKVGKKSTVEVKNKHVSNIIL